MAQSTTASNTLTGTAPTPSQYLGSSNNFDAVFKTNNVERMRIMAANGKVGIGTSTPSEKLVVVGGSISTNASNENGFIVASSSTDKSSWGGPWYGLSHGNSTKLNLSIETIANQYNAPVLVQGYYGLGFRTADGSLVMNQRGNVGIGTTTPVEKLQIGDRWTFHDGGVKYIGYNTDYDGTTNKFIVNGAASQLAWEPSGAMFIATSPAGTAGAVMNSTTKFYLANDGRIGIGDNAYNLLNTSGGTAISANNYRLFVEKGILTEKLKVALKTSTDWADYVFANNYQLKPLAEVESFVKANKHLPDVPSAQELVNDGGIDVGQMLAKQMQKIEELTLYMIDLQKQNDALKSKIEALETK